MSNAAEDLLDAFSDRIEGVVFGLEPVVRGLVVASIVRGHVLLQGVPGIGKTLLARAFTRALGGRFERIQCTADMMPADMTGVHVLTTDGDSKGYQLREGPLFGDVVLADEINRAGPRTQSAMLQAMEERAISLDREIYPLSPDFLVIATQNPHEFEGTYPLPESQLDRFLMLLELDYPEPAAERRILAAYDRPAADYAAALAAIEAVPRELLAAARELAATVHVSDPVYDYAGAIATATRNHSGISLGLSTRGLLALMRTARVEAALAGRDFVTPDDIKLMARSVAPHRLVLTADAQLDGLTPGAVLDDAMSRVTVPPA